MTAPPDPHREPARIPGQPAIDEDALGDFPELTSAIDDEHTPLHELDTIASPELTARLGEPGGERGIGARRRPDDGAIPMLTEVLGDDEGAPGSDPGPSEPEPLAVAGAAVESAAGRPAIDDADWNRIALQVQASVLERLQRRSDRLLDRPMHERLRTVVDLTTARLVEEIRETIRQTVEEAVARAITEELARVHRELGIGEPGEPLL